MEALIICSYGCNPLPVEKYLDFATSEIEKRSPIIIVTTGGITNPREFHSVSEAGMMKDELQRRGIIDKEIIVEKDSVTTIQNIKNAAKIIEERDEPIDQVTIVCDSIRRFKVGIIAKWIFLFDFDDVKIKVIGFDFKRSLWEKLRQIPATVKDILSCFFPALDNYYANIRKKKWGMK